MITFHKIVAGCQTGDFESWRTFAREYTPLAFHLHSFYLSGRINREDLWREALAGLAADGFKRLRDFPQQEEREFLVALRRFLLELGAARLRPGAETRDLSPFDPESVNALLEGLPLLHQEIVFLTLAGYSHLTLERMLRVAPSVASQGLERLRAALGAELDRARWKVAWLEVLRRAWATKTDACPPLRQFIRVQDGQVAWQEKNPLEQHAANCLSCVERTTSLAEVSYWRLQAPRLTEAAIPPLLTGLPIDAPPSEKPSLLKWMFG